MSEKPPRGNKTEKAARFYRDINVIGAVACFGFGILVPPVAIAANALGALNLAQAAGGEIVRRAATKRKK
ncbi:hypothetical protein JNM87_01485 [Candidatus Saccharibacteria bacterium]|nr:hypothetical protein [Candidatus Saccharibacteria bacterium]